ncbi:MAG TPA: transcription antiterminator BglG, partial [Lactobacillus sp.]|nr:transcription antiterminator BglG [Lactobacillus sp.]
MIIETILNNNAVVVRHEQRETIIVERGIGFHAKKGETLTLRDSMKVYVPEDQTKLKIAAETIASLPSEYLTLAARIVQEAEVQLQTTFNSYLLIELADHLHFAVMRLHDNLLLHNRLLWEIQMAYEQEYRMGKWAL